MTSAMGGGGGTTKADDRADKLGEFDGDKEGEGVKKCLNFANIICACSRRGRAAKDGTPTQTCVRFEHEIVMERRTMGRDASNGTNEERTK